MASTIGKRDQNQVTVSMAETNDANREVRAFLVDATTGRLLVDASVTLAANQTVDLNKIGGNAVSVGNGVSGTGVLRVTIASDSTGIVGLATGSNVIGSLTANQSVNVAQMNGTTITMGNGVAGTGVQRVTLASDSTGQVTLATGANTIGALTANQSVNISQMNGVTVSMGAGANGTGVQRVTLATDQTAITTAGVFSVKLDQTTPGTTNGVSIAQLGANTISTGNGASGTGVQRVTIANDSTGILATVTTVTTVSTLTGGGVAHDGADSGNPVKIGAKAISALSTATMVSSADRTDLQSDLDGAIITRKNYPLGDIITERVSDTGGTSTNFSNFSATASTRSYVTVISVFNSSATAGYVDIRDGSAGSILYTIPLPAGGGAIIANGGDPILRSSSNTALAYDVSAALTTVYISMTGFKSKV